MKTLLKISKTINVIALLFLFLGPYGIAITGALQLLAAVIHFFVFFHNRLIHVYFGLVVVFFIFWDGNFGWFFLIPIFLIFFLSYIIHFQKIKAISFLKAEWNNLALFNYTVNPDVLNKYVPKGTELDLWDGKCYVSLVGFMFESVKILGLKIPFHVNFEEVNLRFYVKRFENGEWKRGVVFIKEIVPKYALSFVANTVYKEHYETLPMHHSVQEKNDSTEFVYQWKTQNKWQTIVVETVKNEVAIEVNSEAEFITEHYFGYTKVNAETSYEYEVKHPRWNQLKVTDYRVHVDFERVYGNEFGFLNHQQPTSVLLAVGSEISVENKKRI